MLGGMEERFKMLEQEIMARNQQRIMEAFGQGMNSHFSSAGFGSGWGQPQHHHRGYVKRGCSRLY